MAIEAEYAKRADQMKRAYERQIVNEQEYAVTVIDMCVLYEFDKEIAMQIIQSMPDPVRVALRIEIEKVLSPDYSVEFFYGGPGPSPERRKELNEAGLKSRQTWAQEFRAQLIQK